MDRCVYMAEWLCRAPEAITTLLTGYCCSVAKSRPTLWTWTVARQAPLSFTISWSLLKLMSIESVIPSNHLFLCHPCLLLQYKISFFKNDHKLGDLKQQNFIFLDFWKPRVQNQGVGEWVFESFRRGSGTCQPSLACLGLGLQHPSVCLCPHRSFYPL